MDVILVPKLKHKVILFVAVDNHKVRGVLLLTLISGLLPLGLVIIVVFLSIITINDVLMFCVMRSYPVTRSPEVLPSIVTPGRSAQRPLAHKAGGGRAVLAVKVNQLRVGLQGSTSARGVGGGVVSSPLSDKINIIFGFWLIHYIRDRCVHLMSIKPVPFSSICIDKTQPKGWIVAILPNSIQN